MTIKSFKLIDCDSDEESININWLDEPYNDIIYFDCGCCDNCMCDNNIICNDCGCECCIDFDDEDDNNLNINIIETNMKEKKVRISLELKLNNKETIYIDFDISKNTYLKIAEELFKN